jgi:two-component sensor histidine kinase
VEKHENKGKSVRNSGEKPDCISRTNFEFVLTVADNGDGFPEEIDYRNTNSLGLQIVNILVEQIEGCIELKRNDGTEFSIYFSKLV